MDVEVRLFGPLRSVMQTEAVSVRLTEPATLPQLKRSLEESHPALVPWLLTSRLAINEAFANDDAIIRNGDVVALIPPVSGGQLKPTEDQPVLALVQSEPIDVASILAWLSADVTCGGRCYFEGATRLEHHAAYGRLLHLEYEAYDTMAVAQLSRLAAQAREEFGVQRAAVVHRLGVVVPGDASVFVGVAGGHRAESFSACRWLIDTLKREVPIWKREVYEDGHRQWSDPTSSQDKSEMDIDKPATEGS
ncbi:MAG: molybdenum cofactor biosynthesis protein [Phycisphaerae bacterium]